MRTKTAEQERPQTCAIWCLGYDLLKGTATELQLYLPPTVRMSGSVPPLADMPSLHAQEKLYFALSYTY